MAVAPAVTGAIADVRRFERCQEAVTIVAGVAAPLMLANVDTDVIIRIEWLMEGDRRAKLGAYAFESVRYRPDGTENPDFVLNAPRFQDAPICLARPNFGCGSSRERAVWALMGFNLRCVLAPSFGDIIYAIVFKTDDLEPEVTIGLIESPPGEGDTPTFRCSDGRSATVERKSLRPIPLNA